MSKNYPFILLIGIAFLTSFSVAASFVVRERPKLVPLDTTDYKLANFIKGDTKDLVESTGKKIRTSDQFFSHSDISVSKYYSKVRKRRTSAVTAVLIVALTGFLIYAYFFLSRRH